MGLYPAASHGLKQTKCPAVKIVHQIPKEQRKSHRNVLSVWCLLGICSRGILRALWLLGQLETRTCNSPMCQLAYVGEFDHHHRRVQLFLIVVQNVLFRPRSFIHCLATRAVKYMNSTLITPYNLFLVLSSTAEPNEKVFWTLAPEVTGI